jgi:hypothetical protein
MTNREVLEKFLKGDFSEEEKTFLCEYAIQRKDNELPVLRKIYGKEITTVTKYYKDHNHVEDVKKQLQTLRSRYNNLKKRNGEKSFFNNFEEFLDWSDKNSSNICGYCKITQDQLRDLAELRGPDGEPNITLNGGDKRKTGTMEIDKRDPGEGYTSDNCIFACPFCNNAKSNLIDEDNWRELFSKTMHQYLIDELKKGER